MTRDPEEDITALLKAAGSGDVDAQQRLFQLLYEELRAKGHGRARRGHTWSTSDLVHEALIKLRFGEVLKDAPNRRYLLCAVSRTMLELLVDHARHRATQGHGHVEVRGPTLLDTISDEAAKAGLDVLVLDAPLRELESVNPRQFHALLLQFFLELRVKDIADILGVSEKTVELDLRMAKAWLRSKLGKRQTDES